MSTEPNTSSVPKDHRTWALLAHLGGLSIFLGIPFGNILVPLIVWLVKRHEMPFVDRQAREALNFQISMTIYAVVAYVLVFVLIGWVILVGLGIVNLIVCIQAAIKSNDGIDYEYPLNLRLVK